MNENSNIKAGMNANFSGKFHKNPSPMMIIDIANNCFIKEANAASIEYLGLGKDGIMGKDLSKLLLGDKYSEERCMLIKSQFLTGSVMIEFTDSVGREKVVEVFSVPIYFEESFYDLIMLNDRTAEIRDARLRAALNEISQATNITENLFDLYEKIHVIVSDLMPARNFYIALVDKERGMISFPYFVDEIDAPGGAVTFPEEPINGKTLTGYIIKKQEPLLLDRNDFTNLERMGVVELIGGDSEEWMGVPLKNMKGELIGVVVVQRYDDSTRDYDQIDLSTLGFVSNQIAMAIELKKREEILKFSEAKYRSLIENLSDIIYSFDMRGRLTYVSSAVTKYGYTPEELIGKNIDYIVHEEDVLKFKEHTIQLLKGDFHPVIFRLYNKDRNILYFQTTNSVVEENGKKMINGVLTDITDRILMENDLKSSEHKLQEANQSKDRFFSILAHDLKSPFTGILGFSEFLITEIKELSADEISEFAEKINTSAKAILELLNNLLDWSRIQTNRLKFVPDRVEVDVILHNVNSILLPLTYEKEIELILEVEEGLIVMADKDMLETVIRNLISNSIKFTPRNGSIIVTADKSGDYVDFTISDSGVGMSQATISRLFKINEFVTTAGTENEKGTGLGLLLCYEFIKRHGGLLTVESREGEGSTFSFSIPVYKN
jgi:PAS domain S-box-containing protein